MQQLKNHPTTTCKKLMGNRYKVPQDCSVAKMILYLLRLSFPQHTLYEGEGRTRKRVLVLCTGGTLTMAPDYKNNGALTPVEGKTNNNNDNNSSNKNQASLYFMFLSLRSHSTAYIVASSYCFSKYRSNI